MKKSFNQSLQDIGIKRGRIELLTNLLGYRAVQAHSERQKTNLAAEDRAARGALGWTEGDAEAETDMGGDTILGDVHHAAPVQPRRSGLSSLAWAALGSSLPMAAAAGYLMKDVDSTAAPDPDPIVTHTEELLQISLPPPRVLFRAPTPSAP